jgi:hypothetical protein
MVVGGGLIGAGLRLGGGDAGEIGLRRGEAVPQAVAGDHRQAQARDRQRPVQPLDPQGLPAQRQGKDRQHGGRADRGPQAAKPCAEDRGDAGQRRGGECGHDHGVVLSRGPS